MDLASKVKEAMLRKGKRRVWTKCPRCGKKVSAVLAGRRDHLRMSCETKGCIWVME